MSIEPELTAIKDINANHYAVIEGFIESNAVVFGQKEIVYL